MHLLVTKAPDERICGDVGLQNFITNRSQIKWLIYVGFQSRFNMFVHRSEASLINSMFCFVYQFHVYIGYRLILSVGDEEGKAPN